MIAHMINVMFVLNKLGLIYEEYNPNYIHCADYRFEVRTYNAYELWYFPPDCISDLQAIRCSTDDIKLFEDNIKFIVSRI